MCSRSSWKHWSRWVVATRQQLDWKSSLLGRPAVSVAWWLVSALDWSSGWLAGWYRLSSAISMVMRMRSAFRSLRPPDYSCRTSTLDWASRHRLSAAVWAWSSAFSFRSKWALLAPVSSLQVACRFVNPSIASVADHCCSPWFDSPFRLLPKRPVLDSDRCSSLHCSTRWLVDSPAERPATDRWPMKRWWLLVRDCCCADRWTVAWWGGRWNRPMKGASNCHLDWDQVKSSSSSRTASGRSLRCSLYRSARTRWSTIGGRWCSDGRRLSPARLPSRSSCPWSARVNEETDELQMPIEWRSD